MIWPSLICSSILVASLTAATVTGRVSVEGSKEKRVRNSGDFSDVVIWLEPASTARLALAPQKAVMEQKDKTFIPHVIAVQVGSAVDFPNYDPIFHNAFSNYNGQMFDVGLYPPKSTRLVKFNREGVVRVFCNIHPTMSAVIIVLRTPFFDVTTADGAYQITDVPPGDYTLRVFHERATEATLTSLSRKITVSGDIVIPRFAVSESGYIALPHKNKYGKDYPASVKEPGPYASGLK